MTRFAPRHRTWPPEGYVAPTPKEFEAFLAAARSFTNGFVTRAQWAKLSDAVILRHYQLLEIIPRGNRSDEKARYDYAHVLRRRITERGLTPRPSLKLLRCGSCAHGTERLFEATQDTHPGLSNRSDEPVRSCWLCARCWSDGAESLDPEDDE